MGRGGGGGVGGGLIKYLPTCDEYPNPDFNFRFSSIHFHLNHTNNIHLYFNLFHYNMEKTILIDNG